MAKISEPLLKIIKYRWPEVVLIIGIGTLAVISDQLLIPEKTNSEGVPLPSLQQIIFFIIASIISWGFLRTIYLDSLSYRKPWELFKIGLHFLLRMLGLGLLFGAVFFILFAFICEVAKQWGIYQNKLAEVSSIQPICVIIILLILMKPYLLMPAIIIVMDCKIIESFMALKQFEFLKAKSLILLFCGQLFLIFISSKIKSQSMPLYIVIATISIMANFLTLVVSMKAVKLVSTKNSSDTEQNKTDKTF